MKKAVPIIIVAIVVVAGLIYFLGYKNNNTSYNTSNSNPSKMENSSNQNQSSSNESSQAQATDKVTIKDMEFSPANITVKKGTTVTWTNDDSIGHTVSETDGQQGPNSSTLDKGQTYTFTYNTVGTFKYDCSIHPNMTGIVTVTE